MPDFLIHQRRDGYPVGVWTENAHYYDPTVPASFKQSGEGLVKGRDPKKMSWNDFAEQQASKTPGPGGQWDIVDHREQPLSDVLNDIQNTME